MNRSRAVAVVAIWLAIAVSSLHAQDLSRYRAYVLDSTLDAVRSAGGARVTDSRIVHERPARIQELEWRAPYVSSGAELADPVRTLTFLFYNDVLFQITADYDESRIEGLTVADLVATLSSTYGTPVPASARAGVRRTTSVPPDVPVLAAWESPTASMLLLRPSFSSGLQLVLVSKALSAQAKIAVREAERLDVTEAPRRELERLRQEAVEAEASRLKTRDTNKAAFRP
jgi:hypothetical protein